MKRIVLSAFFVLALACNAMAQEDYQPVTRSIEVFEKGYIQVISESEGGQSRYKAKRAAQVLAQRNLLEIVKGVEIVGGTTVAKGMLVDDTIQTAVSGTLRGAIIVSEQYDEARGMATVVMRANLRGHDSLYSSVAPLLREPSSLLNTTTLPAYKPATPAVQAPAQSYDGLIILVAGTGFRPALAPRIVAENMTVLFEPSKVTPQLLIERGCGGYTTSEAKAKALLSTWGCSAPLVIQCIKTNQGTEAVISMKDAANLFEQDKKANILSEAKVVFVL